jgi:hypothetical protein
MMQRRTPSPAFASEGVLRDGNWNARIDVLACIEISSAFRTVDVAGRVPVKQPGDGEQ